MTETSVPHKNDEGYDLCDYPSDPGQQHAFGWQAREFARVEPAVVVSISPDVCLTPVGSAVVPIPYSIVATPSDDSKSCKSVKLGGKRLYNFGTKITKCSGDQPGSKGGVKSGTVGGICEPKGHAPSVHIEGKPAIRNRELFYMNNGNTVGEIICQKSTDLHWT